MASGESQSPGLKRPRPTDRSPDEFSQTVRRRLEKSSRTGQACDRCKVRKIRCDATPGGCTPCRQNNSECRTIDRITGKATTRGYQDRVDDENRVLRQKVNEYSQQLRDLGVEVPPIEFPAPYAPPPPQSWNASATPWADSIQTGPHPGPTFNSTVTSLLQALPAFRSGAPGDNYLGVSSASSFLSPITGTSLQFFGVKIDVADFSPNDSEDLSSPASYEFFMSAVLGRLATPQLEVPLPQTKDEMTTYADWYFRTLSPYTPILHRPTFMYMIERYYTDASFNPSAAEKVMVHMMLAHLKYQLGQRNQDRGSTEEAHAHYRFSLGLYYDLQTSHKLEDVQSMALICIHMRNFTRPGAAWIMTRVAFEEALELGLHRSAKAWSEESSMSSLEIETRKRVFWTLHGLNVHLSGKLGRPMPIRMEDVDIEFPEPVNDNMPNEPAKCSFLVGIQACKICALLSQMYSSVYAVKRDPLAHEQTVRRLEEMLHQWRGEIPQEISDPSRCKEENRVFAQYVQFWDAEFQLLLHHPAICLSTNPDFVTQNSNICNMAATKMLQVVEQLRQLNSLDLPWINVTVYIAAIFTALFVQSQRQEPIQQIEMEKLQRDMAIWLDIMGEIGKLLGSGTRLQDSIRLIVDQALQNISRRLSISKAQPSPKPIDPTAAMVAAAIATEANRVSQEQQQAQQGQSGVPEGFVQATYPGYGDATGAQDAKPRQTSYMAPDEMGSTNPYPATTQGGYAYPDPSVAANSIPGYVSTNGNAAVNAFAAEQGYVPATAENSIPANAPQPSNSNMNPSQPPQNQQNFNMYAAATPAQPQQTSQSVAAAANAAMYSLNAAVNGGGGAASQPQNEWLRWASGITPQTQGQDYLSGASTLMTLRGTDGSNGTNGTPAAGAAVEGRVQQPQGQWPLMLFDMNANNAGNAGTGAMGGQNGGES